MENSEPNPYKAPTSDAISLGGIESRTFLGHPIGLFVLFFAEMWERFSYYGMRALLVLYLMQHFLFGKEQAYIIYGAYTSLVYITPAIGGWLGDNFLGQRKAVLFGAILLTFGHILMAFEGDGGQSALYLNVFYLALSFIIVGSGFLKANISSIVGSLYDRDDKRKDPAFTIFYMGINLGAALGAIIAGYLGETIGWRYGFGAAGFGMVLGLVVFVLGKPLLMGRGESPYPERLKQVRVGLKTEWLIYIGAVLSVVIVWQLIQYQAIVGWLLGVCGLSLAGYVLYTSATTLASQDRDRIFVAMFLMCASILFWALFEQAGSSLNVFTDQRVDRNMFGFEIPASTFQSINAIYIVLLAPVFAFLWTFLAARKLEPSTPAKFGLAMIQLGAGFLVLVAGAVAAGKGLTPVIFIFAIYLLHTTGELCLSPVGLSAMTKLALPHMVGLIMGTWFFASALGNFAAGLIASATGGGEELGVESVTQVYTTVGWTAVIVGVAIVAVSPFFKRLMHLDSLHQKES
jgi:POT family proton-dependent oligopeptide transporter